MHLTADYDYDLPQGLIASHPPQRRQDSRMMLIHRHSGRIEHRRFAELPSLLRPGDLLALNDTKVIPARVFSADGRIELLVLDRPQAGLWRCLVRPGRRLRPGKTVTVGGSTGTVERIYENGDRLIRWDAPPDLARHGRLALPHYMGRQSEAEDAHRYQTVFAREEGAIAAPTAGLHFTPEMLAPLPHVFLTLHVGVGTFRPVSVERISDHVMHSERYSVPEESSARINAAGRLIAVGTTVTRVLESLRDPSGARRIRPGAHRGETAVFLHPPYQFGAVDLLLTNFHLPQSTLLMLVCAFAGRDLTLEAYRKAIEERYRFYSYGDCMLIL